ncbi:MAG TPA: hypothetical protein VN786_08515 [Acidimicrobiales bacterium]|nr:hypothetical protein [Acidimicrobiales bacterium]
MSLLRRGSPPPDSDEDASDGEDDGQVTTVDVSSRTAPEASSATSAKEIERKQKELVRKQKAADRASYQELRRQAAKATSAMQDPEPRRGLYVGAFMVGLAALSYFGKDVYPKLSTVHGKTVTHWLPITHPETAIILFLVTVGAAVSIYWRRRYVTAIAFFVAGVLGIDTPFPTGLTDLEYLVFATGGGYFIWVIMFRMNKQKKEWMSAHSPKASRSGSSTSPSSGSSKQSRRKRSGGGQAAAPAARSRKAKADEPVVTATGRALPASNSRYTRPQGKSRASQRRS